MPCFRPQRILYRITVPFTLLFAATTVFFWLFSAYFITSYLDYSLKQQMKQVVSIISHSGYVLNRSILHRLKQVINSEIVLFGQDGRVLNTTLPDSVLGIEMPDVLEGRSRVDEPLVGKDLEYEGVRYRTVICPVVLPEHGPAVLSLWLPARDTDRLKRRIILSMGGVALLGIFAVAVAGHFIARTITAPVQGLVKVTERVSEGDLNERASVQGRDELGILAHSFNQMIERLRDFEQRLVESERLATAGQVAAGLAHEVRNPLTSIKMLWQVLHNRLESEPEHQKILRSLVQEIGRLDRIVQEMIDKARVGAVHMASGDLNAQVEEVLGVAQENLSAQSIAVEQNLFSLPRVYMDQERIKQVLWNLLLNAKEAMPKGGRLVVSTRVAGPDVVEVCIDDSGQGFTTADAETLFQPFFTTKPEGIGLGLTVSRKIAESHGGSLVLENRPGGGVRVRMRLSTTGKESSRTGAKDKDSGC